jgi:hypothetical protein
MAYFYLNQDRVDRGGKIVADIVCGALLLFFALAFFGLFGGMVAFIILEAGLIGIDFMVPDENADAGAVIR